MWWPRIFLWLKNFSLPHSVNDSYKYKTKIITMWEDVGDVSFITALTGYIGEKLLTKNEGKSKFIKNFPLYLIIFYVMKTLSQSRNIF